MGVAFLIGVVAYAGFIFVPAWTTGVPVAYSISTRNEVPFILAATREELTWKSLGMWFLSTSGSTVLGRLIENKILDRILPRKYRGQPSQRR